MIGRAAVPTALMRLPRLTFNHDTPVPPKTITPGSMFSVTTLFVDEGPWSVPTSTRPPRRYRTPAIFGNVLVVLMRAGKVQTRYVPVGPVIVPLSVKPCASAIVGQPPAGVTVAVGGGGGGGGGAAGLLMVMLPPVPGDAISSAPQPVTRAAAAVAYTIPRNFGFNILNLRNK